VRSPTAPAPLGEAAAEAERVVAWLRLPAIGLLALAESLPHIYGQTTEFHVALGLFAAWSVGLLAWMSLRPVGTRLAFVVTGVDIAAISILALLSGGPFSNARLAFFLVPVAVAFRFRPSMTAVAAVATTAAYVMQALFHPASDRPHAARFVVTQAGFIGWIGLACALLSLLLARRTDLARRLAEQQSHLLADALEAEQRERRTLAEALHDQALQTLLWTRHELQEAGETLGQPGIGRLDDALAETVRQLREAVLELHPYVLDEAGLKAAVQALAEQAARRAGLELWLDLRYRNRHPREQLLYSAARELLLNVAEHAGATRVTVRLAEIDGELELAVEDDGRGFSPEKLAGSLAGGHVGLASQRVRIEAAGGRMAVASAPGRGTRVAIRLKAH
jgi:two-component system NarL family sensor kinase